VFILVIKLAGWTMHPPLQGKILKNHLDLLKKRKKSTFWREFLTFFLQLNLNVTQGIHTKIKIKFKNLNREHEIFKNGLTFETCEITLPYYSGLLQAQSTDCLAAAWPDCMVLPPTTRGSSHPSLSGVFSALVPSFHVYCILPVIVNKKLNFLALTYPVLEF
jgi:hypothetical protein